MSPKVSTRPRAVSWASSTSRHAAAASASAWSARCSALATSRSRASSRAALRSASALRSVSCASFSSALASVDESGMLATLSTASRARSNSAVVVGLLAQPTRSANAATLEILVSQVCLVVMILSLQASGRQGVRASGRRARLRPVRLVTKRVHPFHVLNCAALSLGRRSIGYRKPRVDRRLTRVALGVVVLVRLIRVLGEAQPIPCDLEVLTRELCRTRLLRLLNQCARRLDLRLGIGRRSAGRKRAGGDADREAGESTVAFHFTSSGLPDANMVAAGGREAPSALCALPGRSAPLDRTSRCLSSFSYRDFRPYAALSESSAQMRLNSASRRRNCSSLRRSRSIMLLRAPPVALRSSSILRCSAFVSRFCVF